MKEWHYGPPPEIGWWPASANKEPNIRSIRWWNGREWSYSAYPDNTAREAGLIAEYSSQFDVNQVRWTDRWWL